MRHTDHSPRAIRRGCFRVDQLCVVAGRTRAGRLHRSVPSCLGNHGGLLVVEDRAFALLLLAKTIFVAAAKDAVHESIVREVVVHLLRQRCFVLHLSLLILLDE